MVQGREQGLPCQLMHSEYRAAEEAARRFTQLTGLQAPALYALHVQLYMHQSLN